MTSWKHIELSDAEIEPTLRLLLREAERTQLRDINAHLLGKLGFDFEAAADPAVAAAPVSRQRRRAAERAAQKARKP